MFKVNMLVATNTTGQQQLGKTPTLSLNTTTCLPSISACVKSNTNNTTSSSAPNNASISPNNLTIMSSSLDVSAPTSTANVSPPNSNNNTTGNNLKCNNTSNNNNTSQKYDAPYGGNVTSPCNSDGNNSQNLDDTNGNNKNKSKNSNGVNLNSMDTTSRGERDSLCNISSNTLIRQSSASTNSCSLQFNESSPNNGDSSSNSSNSSHMNNENNKSNDEEKLNNNQTTKNSTIIKEEERDKSNSSSSNTSSLSGNGNTNTSLPNQQASLNNIKMGLPAAIVKDEKDLVKKEEASLSPPNMSPVGFGSIVGTQINDCNENPGSTTNKSSDSSSSCDKRMVLQGNVCNDNDDSSVQQNSGGLIAPGSGANLNLINNCNALNTNNNNSLNSKSTLDGFCSDGSTSTSIGSNTPNTSCNIPLNPSFIINNLSQTNGPPQGGTGGGGGGGVGNNIISGGGSGLNNCMEYMQQQNHIFVFSTQLANKGAEAVLAGQFPTIIAYHCTQPATKSFFEDFFLKNPMKMTKLQRQNTLNIMGGLTTGAGGPVSGGQPPWLTGNCNTMGKMSHKLALNKSETITSSSSSSNSTAGGVLNENEMMCWNQSNSVLDSPAGDSASSIKMLENTENSSNTAKAICTGLSNDENGGIPSLQGVKVPDENLTPQQRQHREEQLAKLKKMNQFLFPENGGNDFHSQGPSNQIMSGKMQMPSEAMAASMPGNPVALMNMTGPNMGNKINAAAMRNIAGNLMNHSKAGASNTQLDNIPNLGEDIIMPADMMGGGPNEMTVIPPNIKQGCMPNINNTGGLSAASGGRGLMNTGGSNLTMMNNSGSIGTMPSGNLMNDPNSTMMSNSADVLSTFNANHCPGPNQEGNGGGMMGSHKNINAPPNHPSDINSAVGMSQMEWSKLHHHIYEERLKNNHPNNNNMPPELSGGPNGCQQTLTRCNSTGIGGAGGMTTHRSNPNANPNNRGNQGPPPPYHPTQRSASVPIATQSPNPSSPNNPTSNMSLPSPRASNTMGGAMSLTTSPSMDVTSASSASTANTNSTTTTTTAGCSNTSSGNSSSNKNTFSQQGSPTSCSASGNSNRNRSNVNSLNSNPTTPLSHVSPKDINSKDVNTTPTPDHISSRPKSQRSRSPLLNDVPNNAMEPRFPSPGLNFTSGGTSGGNTQNLSSGFKNQSSSLEQRQNLQQMPPQFCRRTDNMPLNPNSNRSSQAKMSNSFDPISSLAQMSQQLTGGSGVGLNSGGVGNSPNNMPGLMGGPVSVNDINMNGLMGGPMMGGGPLDPGMDHCNQNPNGGGGGNMGMSGLGGGPGSLAGPFGPGNCNMMAGNPGPICQRLLNPKMCAPNMSGGFNPNQVGGGMGGMRDGPAGFPGMMPTHRMMNHRMTANFGNFNVSPNIQVKASTPNTIQYMPVRPQNNNSNSNNMRVPPSLEFLQRYANPQMLVNSGAGGVGGPGVGGPVSSPADMPGLNGPSDLNKMPNTSNNMGVNPNAMNQMNFFGNCNQMSAMSGMSQPGGDPDELQGGGGMMASHDHMNIPGPHAPMLRGMRPMRQGGLQSNVGMNSVARMQHPGMGNMPPNGLGGNNPFSGNDNESLDCNDPTNNMFNNPAAANLYQQQQKNNKPPPMGMSHGPNSLNPNNSNNISLPNTNNIINEPNPSSNPMQSSVMMGPNNTLLNTSNIPNTNNVGPNGPLSGPGNMGYKPFVGPSSNDLKYAQQYHSFQQQLYATSTRNQQPGGGQQQPPNAMSPNSNPNVGFFVNK